MVRVYAPSVTRAQWLPSSRVQFGQEIKKEETTPESKPPENMYRQHRKGGPWSAVLFVLGIGALLFNQGFHRLNEKFDDQLTGLHSDGAQVEDAAAGIDKLDYTQLVEQISKAGVGVYGKSGLGSGFWVQDAEGNLYIVTNHHVVDDNKLYDNDDVPHTYKIRLHNGTEAEAAQEVFAQIVTLPGGELAMSAQHDMALLAVSTPNFRLPDGVEPVQLRNLDTDPLRSGERVLAVGTPFNLTDNVSTGVIGFTERHLDSFEPANIFITTDAPINPGNSGGALYDMEGRLIGINTGTIFGVDGMGLSIHTAVIQEMLEHWGVAAPSSPEG